MLKLSSVALFTILAGVAIAAPKEQQPATKKMACAISGVYPACELGLSHPADAFEGSTAERTKRECIKAGLKNCQ